MRVTINFKYLLILACVLWHFVCVPAASAEIYIIANVTVPYNAISKEELRNIFIGKKVIWEADLKVVPVIMPSEPIHDEFVVKSLQKSRLQFKNWWVRLVFSGEGTFPKSASSEEEMIALVSQYEGAIGYASVEVNTDKVKTINVFDKDAVIKNFEKNKGSRNE